MALSPPVTSSSSEKKHKACDFCKSKKLKCSGDLPACQSCAKNGLICEFNSVHKKSGPQKGYLQKLEDRLESLEAFLKENVTGISSSSKRVNAEDFEIDTLDDIGSHHNYKRVKSLNSENSSSNGSSPFMKSSTQLIMIDEEEPWPSQSIIDVILDKFFDEFHLFLPLLNPALFRANVRLKKIKPYLLYAVLAIGANMAGRNLAKLREQYTERSMKYIFLAEMKSIDKEYLGLEYTQALLLLATLLYRDGNFGRAWIMTGKATRAVQLNNLDKVNCTIYHNHKTINRRRKLTGNVLITRSLEEVEELQRTYWCVYFLDRFTSIAVSKSPSLRQHECTSNVPLNDSKFGSETGARAAPFNMILNNPSKYLLGSESTLAYIALLTYSFTTATELAVSVLETDSKSTIDEWWVQNQKLESQVVNIGRTIPPLSGAGSNDMRTVFLHGFFYTALLSTHHAGFVRTATATDTPYKHPFTKFQLLQKCFQSAVNISRTVRYIDNIVGGIGQCPSFIYCLQAAALSLVSFINDPLTPPENIPEFRKHLDYILANLDVMRKQIPMASISKNIVSGAIYEYKREPVRSGPTLDLITPATSEEYISSTNESVSEDTPKHRNCSSYELNSHSEADEEEVLPMQNSSLINEFLPQSHNQAQRESLTELQQQYAPTMMGMTVEDNVPVAATYPVVNNSLSGFVESQDSNFFEWNSVMGLDDLLSRFNNSDKQD